MQASAAGELNSHTRELNSLVDSWPGKLNSQASRGRDPNRLVENVNRLVDR